MDPELADPDGGQGEAALGMTVPAQVQRQPASQPWGLGSSAVSICLPQPFTLGFCVYVFKNTFIRI